MAMIETPIIERRRMQDRRGGANSRKLNAVDWVAMVLLIVGGVNWGLIGLIHIDLVSVLFGDMTIATRVIYLAMGVSALYAIYTCIRLSGNSDYTTS